MAKTVTSTKAALAEHCVLNKKLGRTIQRMKLRIAELEKELAEVLEARKLEQATLLRMQEECQEWYIRFGDHADLTGPLD